MGRWWNEVWGRLTRRDVWLAREVRWHVVARAGDSETGKVLRFNEARAMVRRLVQADGGAVDPAHGSAWSEFN
ncbi:hypothetical protein GA0074696_4073 [Micromonospora purpureochromogenes]|uniref:Uncharacterized protein n=2 Tax=Micromonospora purpureochromogenes TaxID=47872 RepID=A0A1C4Z6W8_9ACTN|nr:hypothetical protein [Micromonospora purpureochromogenes]SCF28381.1 hypothetical protein GA0074696_4073 [Micromonospora purpureochromogenes]